MNDANFVSDYLPEPPTPTSKQLPLGEFMILVILNKCFNASSKMTKFIFFEGYFSLYASNFKLAIFLIASMSRHAS